MKRRGSHSFASKPSPAIEAKWKKTVIKADIDDTPQPDPQNFGEREPEPETISRAVRGDK